jgi:hypothetical protein
VQGKQHGARGSSSPVSAKPVQPPTRLPGRPATTSTHAC